MTVYVKPSVLNYSYDGKYRWELRVISKDGPQAPFLAPDEIEYHVHGYVNRTNSCIFQCIYFDRQVAERDLRDLAGVPVYVMETRNDYKWSVRRRAGCGGKLPQRQPEEGTSAGGSV